MGEEDTPAQLTKEPEDLLTPSRPVEMPSPSPESIRLRCLEAAARVHSGVTYLVPATSVVSAARAFEQFVKGAE